jgi:hypothetical protein
VNISKSEPLFLPQKQGAPPNRQSKIANPQSPHPHFSPKNHASLRNLNLFERLLCLYLNYEQRTMNYELPTPPQAAFFNHLQAFAPKFNHTRTGFGTKSNFSQKFLLLCW